jgi:ABC-2 type transport system ATP-binding protein
VSDIAVSTQGLTKRYRDRLAVDHLDLTLPAGALCGFVGPNGAGKTTTIRMLLGLVAPTSGTGSVLGFPLSEPGRYLPRVGALIDGPAFYPSMSGRQNLEVLAHLGDMNGVDVERALELVGLRDRAGERVRSYSLGMRQRLGIAAALLPDPALLVLDEPTNGLDPAGICEIRALLRHIADRGTTVFVSSHLLMEIEAISDHVVLIERGRLVLSGRLHDLLARRRARLVLRAQRDTDGRRLLGLCTMLGHEGRLEADGRVVVEGVTDAMIADINRRAMAAGVTLVELTLERPTLEDVFFTVSSRAVDVA